MQRSLGEFLKKQNGNGTTGKPRVILIGHSVGSYIAMEVLRRHREQRKASAALSDGNDDFDIEFDIIGGIMLFPTVIDIAKSPSGVKLTVSVIITRVGLDW